MIQWSTSFSGQSTFSCLAFFAARSFPAVRFLTSQTRVYGIDSHRYIALERIGSTSSLIDSILLGSPRRSVLIFWVTVSNRLGIVPDGVDLTVFRGLLYTSSCFLMAWIASWPFLWSQPSGSDANRALTGRGVSAAITRIIIEPITVCVRYNFKQPHHLPKVPSSSACACESSMRLESASGYGSEVTRPSGMTTCHLLCQT